MDCSTVFHSKSAYVFDRNFPSVFHGVFVVDPHIDFIWSVGKSTKFERHIGFGEDRLEYEVMDNLFYLCVSIGF